MKHSHCVKYEIKIALVPFRNEGSAALFNYRFIANLATSLNAYSKMAASARLTYRFLTPAYSSDRREQSQTLRRTSG